MILLLVAVSAVFGCGVIPGGQTSTRTFTASGPATYLLSRFTQKTKQSLPIPWYCNQQRCCSGICTTLCNANTKCTT
ncbi:hypothetical protein KIN20_028331 [Parelaphostrongylus tenuis]|uniref:Uncharacterized protein n=1 Tax=Parelaphostrongylus tenuis TaxID=148309 RepID=A0AAD5R105_PARTN|nr:hypothetical protein KIN20_028331 [Parelaphostrongylus tenuis]